MTDSEFNFWQRWLTWANVMTVMVGLIAAFAGNSIFFEAHNSYTEEVFFNGNKMEAELLNFKNWLFGIIGGTIVGYHILMILISENAFKKKERWAYQAIWFALLSWFIIDSGLSYYYGAMHNIITVSYTHLTLPTTPYV